MISGSNQEKTGGRPSAHAALDVVPTPPPSRRFSDVQPWDETTRPTSPPPDPGATYPEQGRQFARHLIEIHDHLRQELAQVRDLVAQVLDGSLDVGAARSAINVMTMRQNKWALGAYCQNYCRILTTHHTLEDRALFPRLRRADDRLGPVLDRLADEHEVIAEVLDSVDAALVAMVSSPDDGGHELRRAVDLLTDTLLSHLSYEERELIEPLSRLAPEAGLV